MGPLVAAALGGATILGGLTFYNKFVKTQPLDPNKVPLTPGGAPGQVSLLDSGRVYAVQCMFDVKKLPGSAGQVPNVQGGSDYLKAVFNGCGFNVLSAPAARDDAAIKKYLAGEPSDWVLTAQWKPTDSSQRTVKLDDAVVQVIPSAIFFILPTTA
jgi:hypothetical protein